MIATTLILYARLEPGAVLDHGLRRAILAAVRARPGVSMAQLAREHRVDPKTVAHHVRQLQRAGRLRAWEPGGHAERGLFVPGAHPAGPPPRALAALRALLAGSGTPARLARALGIPRGTAGSLLEAMARAGLVRRCAEGWRVREEALAFLGDPGRGAS